VDSRWFCLAPRAITDRLLELGKRLHDSLQEARSQALAVQQPSQPLAEEGPEPPVVARLLVEIRSDGTRTIARGAIEDNATNQRVAVEAQGTTPAELAASLAKSMFSMPSLAAAAVRAVLAQKPDGRDKP
jgi:hypothetical protein